MTNFYRIRPYSYLGWWIANSIFVYPLAVITGGVIIFPLSIIGQALMPRASYGYGYDYGAYNTYGDVMAFIAIGVAGLAIGIAVGHLQRWLLRNHLYWSADSWRRQTILGGLIGAFIVTGIVSETDIAYSASWLDFDELQILLAMPIFVAIVSMMQWFSLRHAVRDAWLWVLGNIVAGMVFSGIIVMNEPNFYSYYYSLHLLVIMGLAVVAQGFITGIVMLFLFENKLLPMQPEDGSAIRPHSVWDEVID